MIRRPPRSTLFPYTNALPISRRWTMVTRVANFVRKVASSMAVSPPWRRSEEHTSELQSHLNLVCRLLLEKKKNKLLHQLLDATSKPSSQDMLETRNRSVTSRR